jgi:hypothetical protein
MHHSWIKRGIDCKLWEIFNVREGADRLVPGRASQGHRRRSRRPVEKSRSATCFEPGIDVLTVNKRFAMSLRLTRSWQGTGREPIWTIHRRAVLPSGHIIAIRLGEGKNRVLDYFLLPTREMIGSKIRFMEAGLHRFDGRRFRTSAHLTKAILHQIVCRADGQNESNLSRLDLLSLMAGRKRTMPDGGASVLISRQSVSA